MQLALARTRTRVYGVDKNHSAIVPGADLLNTSPQKGLNTAWDFHRNPNRYSMTTKQSISAGQELYDSYCATCTNAGMLIPWGVYLEDNTNVMTALSAESCAKLRQPALVMLNTASLQPGWTAPRCFQEKLAEDQGPLRCSLARLAWEQCKGHFF